MKRAWIGVALLAARGFSMVEIGVVEGVFHVASLLFEIPSGVISDVFSHGVVAFLYVIERCCFSPTMKNEETKALWEDLRMSHLCLRTPFLLYLVCCLCHLDVYTTQHKYGWQCQRQSGQDLE